ncbi:TPA: hypothetical protein L5C46_003808 [Pseudomonas aeruginosa]|nr:hypothetical protein [Pseudomonas aeruginosa]
MNYTSVSAGLGFTLSRYRLTKDPRYPFSREGHPANLKRLTRATWKDFVCGANGAER